MAKELEDTLKKLQDGAAENNATVMLEGERYRVRTEDGYSTLYELDQKGSGFKVVERMTAQGTPEPVKDGGEASSVDAAIKDMEEGPKKRKDEADKKLQEAEKKAEAERGGPLNPGLRAAAGVDDKAHGHRPQAQPTPESISPKAHR